MAYLNLLKTYLTARNGESREWAESRHTNAGWVAYRGSPKYEAEATNQFSSVSLFVLHWNLHCSSRMSQSLCISLYEVRTHWHRLCRPSPRIYCVVRTWVIYRSRGDLEPWLAATRPFLDKSFAGLWRDSGIKTWGRTVLRRASVWHVPRCKWQSCSYNSGCLYFSFVARDWSIWLFFIRKVSYIPFPSFLFFVPLFFSFSRFAFFPPPLLSFSVYSLSFVPFFFISSFSLPGFLFLPFSLSIHSFLSFISVDFLPLFPCSLHSFHENCQFQYPYISYPIRKRIETEIICNPEQQK